MIGIYLLYTLNSTENLEIRYETEMITMMLSNIVLSVEKI